MADALVSVDQAADELKLHPKTVLRYIRDGRLPATRVGKSYRIRRTDLEAFAGIAAGSASPRPEARATCIVDIPELAVERAERIATMLQAIALSGDSGTPPLHLETAYDPERRTMKVVIIGTPSDAGRLLEMLDIAQRDRP